VIPLVPSKLDSTSPPGLATPRIKSAMNRGNARSWRSDDKNQVSSDARGNSWEWKPHSSRLHRNNLPSFWNIRRKRTTTG